MAAAEGRALLAQDIAARHYGEQSSVVHFAKAAVQAAHTGSDNWGGSIAQNAGREFIELVNEMSVVGRIGLRPAPFNCRLVAPGTGASASWVGQGRAAPLTSIAFSNDQLLPLKVASTVVLSKNLLEFGDPQSDFWIRDELLRAAVARLDTDFLNPDNAGVSDVSPASPLNGVTPLMSSGDIGFDFRELIDDFAGDLSRAVFVARPDVFAAFQANGHQYTGLRGGELLTAPCLATRHAPAGTLVLIDPAGICLGDGGIEVDVADQASAEMLDGSLEQDGTDGTGATTAGMVSFWQANLIGIKIERRMNWAMLRDSVAILDSVEYEATSA
ncbi:phage major capsid protein [Parvularcula marina]|nr:phage major capsid protein [Parvularcula marina]